MIEKFDTERYPETTKYVLKRLCTNVRCNRCNQPVLRSELEGYEYQCVEHDEDLYGAETHNREPYTADELNKLCINTKNVLGLDD